MFERRRFRCAGTSPGRVEERFGLTPERLIGDTAYGSAPMLAWLVEDKTVEPRVPVWPTYATRFRPRPRRGTRAWGQATFSVNLLA